MSEFVEVKTTELIGPALDWAVAKAVSHAAEWDSSSGLLWFESSDLEWLVWSPSTYWEQGGPLRDKYRVSIDELAFGHGVSAKCWDDSEGHQVIGLSSAVGEKALVAICRAVAGSKLGDSVQVPAELVRAL